MADNAGEDPSPYSTTVSYLNLLFGVFASNTDVLSYLILCVVKMPFIPPVSVSRPPLVSAPVSTTISMQTLHSPTSSPSAFKTKVLVEVKPSSVKDRLASNLRQLGRRDQPRSRLPVSRCPQLSGLCVEGRNRRFPSKETPPMDSSCEGHSSSPASSSGEFLSQQEDSPTPGMRSEPEAENDGVHFRLTLTPEAVLLLQRRNRERQKQSATRSGPTPAGDPCGRPENVSKRHPAGERGSGGPSCPALNSSTVVVPDASSLLQISLLNDRHKYDDEEYEEEQNRAVDEGVVAKCTEWLRGLESAAVTVNSSLEKGVTSLKSF